MSPQAYQRRLTSLFNDMEELYQAGHENPVLQVSLMHLNKARAVIQGSSVNQFLNQRYSWRARHYVERTVQHLRRTKRPATLQDILAKLKELHPTLADVQYRTFHPTIRNEIMHHSRRLAECGIREGKRLYGLPHWKDATSYTPGVKHGS